MIDWQEVTLKIRARYAPLSRVAKEVGSDWRHINRLARGETREPKYSVGVSLLQIYDRIQGGST